MARNCVKVIKQFHAGSNPALFTIPTDKSIVKGMTIDQERNLLWNDNSISNQLRVGSLSYFIKTVRVVRILTVSEVIN